MITNPQENQLADYRPITLLFGATSIGLLFFLVLIGGLLFWASQLRPMFIGYTTDKNEIEVARSSLKTMKRMVNDQEAWSKVIQEEYARISVTQLTNN